MYLILILFALAYLLYRDWKIGICIALIVFCLDRIIDSNRREAELKFKEKDS